VPASVVVDFAPFRRYVRDQLDEAVGARESQVEACAAFVSSHGGPSDPLSVCGAGGTGIDDDEFDVNGLATNVSVRPGGVIVVASGPERQFFVRTPTWHQATGTVTWATSGTCDDDDVDLC
jgi:hypothetical protein